MQTYSHFILTAVIRQQVQKHRKIQPHRSLLWGSFMPDLPLTLVALGYIVYYHWRHKKNNRLFSQAFQDNYFHNPWWIATHNLFHAPLILLPLGLLGLWGMAWQKKWGALLFWFATGCGLHTAVDIFTHVNDGPALLFPIDWDYRYSGTISYWDPQHGGHAFAFYEHLLDSLLLLYFFSERFDL